MKFWKPSDSLDSHQTSKNRHVWQAFYYAVSGLKTAFKEERNLKIQAGLGILALITAYILNVSLWEWIVIIYLIAWVITLELVNTVFEHLVDLITDCTYHPIAKKVKDISAGFVLFNSFVALMLVLIIFIFHLLH